ncbi:hypothetical protein A4G18_09550 [Pasteurellaceae bacterium Pebbles2]|nr:hypothetical protein [Pasteurellaceae bacterium Pebbles2]
MQQIENQQDATFGEIHQPVLASRLRRFAAALINIVMFNALLIILGFILGLSGSNENGIDEDGIASIAALFGIAVYVAIQLYFMAKHQQTLGKYWLKVKLVNYKTRQPLSFGRYLGREVLDMIFGALGLPMLISYGMILFSKERRSLSDLIVSSLLVSAK